MSENKSVRRSTVGKWILSIVCVLVAVAILLSVAIGVTLHMGRAALAPEIERIREAGGALTFEEWLAELPPLPDDENSARVILAVADQLRAFRGAHSKNKDLPWLGKATRPGWPARWPEEMAEAADELLSDHEALLVELDVIADMPRGRFDHDYSGNPLEVMLPELSPVRTTSRLMAIAAERDARRGDTDQAVRRLLTTLNIGRSLEDSRCLASVYSVARVDSLAAELLEHILAQNRFDAPTLELLQQAFAERADINLIKWSLSGERVAQIEIYTYMRQHGTDTTAKMTGAGSGWPKSLSWALRGIVDLNLAKSLELITPVVEASDSHMQVIRAAKRMGKAFDANAPGDWRYFLAQSLTPGLLWACQDLATRMARMRCAVTAMAVERFRLNNGRWPTSLDELVSEYLDAVPLDPFDEQPLRYAIKDGYVAIYSIGHDGVDDGGALAKPIGFGGRPRRAPDVGFRLLNVESNDGDDQAAVE